MKPKLILALGFLFLTIGCFPLDRLILRPVAIPPPGWRSLVSDLLLNDEDLPAGWARVRDLPKRSLDDATINHVYRSWWDEARGEGAVQQSINRAHTIEDAQNLFADRRRSQFFADRTPPPPQFFVPYVSPEEIAFQSTVADEFYLACGFRVSGHCRVLARYRNYVVEMLLERESDYEGHITHGLTYPEIETVVKAMDAKFAKAMAEWYPETP